MSRSYRKPYAAVTGTKSAKDDKRLAHRGVRRAQNLALKMLQDAETFLVPHKLECAWNNTYSWGRDGSQYLHFPPIHSRSMGWHWARPEKLEEWYQWDLRYYRRLLRK